MSDIWSVGEEDLVFGERDRNTGTPHTEAQPQPTAAAAATDTETETESEVTEPTDEDGARARVTAFMFVQDLTEESSGPSTSSGAKNAFGNSGFYTFGRRSITIGERIALLYDTKGKYSDVTFIVGSGQTQNSAVVANMDPTENNGGGSSSTSETSTSDNNNQGTEKIPAHKLILALSSPVFASMFYSQMESYDTIRVPDCTPTAFKLMLEYIYKGNTTATKASILDGVALEELIDIFYVARKYAVIGLEDDIQELLSGDIVKPSTVLQILQAAIFYELSPLTQYCWSYIQMNVGDVLETSLDNPLLDFSLLEQILGKDGLKIKEVDLFKLLLLWAKLQCTESGLDPDDPKSIISTLGPLLYLIRFPTMTGQEFADTVVPTGLLTDQQMVSIFIYISRNNIQESKDKCTTSGGEEFPTEPRKPVIPLCHVSTSEENGAGRFGLPIRRSRGRRRRNRNQN